jgi:hypothetical protein
MTNLSSYFWVLVFLLPFRSMALTATNLACEDRNNPLGIDVAQPRLSWTLQSSQRGDMQTAYEIQAASSPALLAANSPDLWDSGTVATNRQNQISYGGAALQTSQLLFWRVRVWDGNGVVSQWSTAGTWTMGVLKPADWQAQWIMGLQRQSIGYHAQTSVSQNVTKWVQIDLGQAYPITNIVLHPKWNQGISGYGFPVRFHIEVSNDPTFATSNSIVNQTTDYNNPGYDPVPFAVSSISARYVRITATKLYYYLANNYYAFALSQLEVDSWGTNVALNAAVSALDSLEQSGWGAAGLTDGAGFVGCDYGRRIRREFTVQPGLQRAIVQVSGLGEYEMSVNGGKVGNDLLSPGWSYYGPTAWQVGTNETVLYNTRDITSQVLAGTNNAIGLILGNSFYNITAGYGRYVKFTQSFGPLRAIVQVRLDYTNGTTQIIGSDTSWQTGPGAISFENVYAGEDYDARLEPAGWNLPGYKNLEWTPAVLTSGPGGTLKGLSCSAPPIGKFDVFTPVATNVISAGAVISWNENDGNTIPSSGSAGVVATTNWNNSNAGMALADNIGAASGASFTISGTWGPWEITPVAGPDASGTYNETLLSGYANTSSGRGPEVFSFTGIPYSIYNLIVYFSSDTANRSGTISCANAGITYDFSTIGPASVNGSNAILTQTTDTTGANPLANYAIFSNVSGSSATLTLNIPSGGGIAGFQIAPAQEQSTVVYDLGQNATVVPQLQVSGPAGSYVQIIPSELLGANGLVDRTTCAQSSPPPPAWWQYTLSGKGNETWTPQFFIQGSRYLQVQLFSAPGGSILPTLQSLQGAAIHSTAKPIGSFNCSNPLFNQIYSLVRWAQMNNMESYMSDCPHRERLGWLEQVHLNGPSLRYNFDMAPLFTKIENDIYDSQWTNNGFVPNIAPEYFQTSNSLTDPYHNSPEWGSTFIQGAWQQYQFSGDISLLQRFYPAMKAYLNFLTSTANNYIVGVDLGDWYDVGQLAAGNFSGVSLTSKTLPGTAIYYSDAVEMAQMAQVLGNSADVTTYNQLAANIRAAFNQTFFKTATGVYDTSSQTANGMPLALGLVDATNIPSVTAALVNDIQSRGNTLTSGEIGFGYVLRALQQAGRADVIYVMNNQTNTPGYGYQIAHGCTSLTERWDNANILFSSQDHFMLGEIMEWLYHDLAGIQPDPAGPGFQKIIIKPTIVGNLTSVTGTYNSASGPITNQWSVSGNQVAMNVAIPPGTTATVYLPTLGTNLAQLSVQESGVTIWTNGTVAASAPNVTFIGAVVTNGQTSLLWAIGSGNYQFNWNVFPAPSQLTATAANNSVRLSWGGVGGATGYNLNRSTNSGGPYTLLAGGIAGTNYTDGAVVSGTTYYYVVSAQSPAAVSVNSFEASATPSFVLNFGFETPSIGTYQYNPSGGSWSFTAQSGMNGSGITANNSLFTTGNPNAPQGIQSAFLQGIGSIAQTITGFVPGLQYNLTFAAAQRATYENGGQTWNVMVDNSVIGSYSPAASATNYAIFSTNFTASAPTHTLAFIGTDLNGNDNTVFLDNIQLTPAPPSTPPQIGWQMSKGQLQLSWPVDHFGWHLEMQVSAPNAGLGTNWVAVPGSQTTNLINTSLLTGTGSVFFRLVYP